MEGVTCRDVIVEFLADYLDGTLPSERSEEIQRHLQACMACMAYLNTYKKTRDLVGRHAAQAGMPAEMKDILRRSMLQQMAKPHP